MVRLSPLEAIQRRAWLTASTSVVKLEVETVCAASYVLGDFVFGVCVCGGGGGGDYILGRLMSVLIECEVRSSCSCGVRGTFLSNVKYSLEVCEVDS